MVQNVSLFGSPPLSICHAGISTLSGEISEPGLCQANRRFLVGSSLISRRGQDDLIADLINLGIAGADKNAHCPQAAPFGKILQVIPTTQGVSKLRRSSRGKEAVLLFLAAFYFLIATNTQSGWLFLLSAFLLGLLAMCWHPPRRAARYTSLSRELLGSPQRGVAMVVRLRLTNNGPRPLREVLVIEPANAWSAEAKEFRWVVPRLAAGESVSTQ
jgi:hypothetical protein